MNEGQVPGSALAPHQVAARGLCHAQGRHAGPPPDRDEPITSRMKLAQYKLRRIQDELEYYLMKTPAANVTLDDLDPFFERLQGVWTETSERWLADRPLGRSRELLRAANGTKIP